MKKCKLPPAVSGSQNAIIRGVDASFEVEAAQQIQTLRSLVCDLLKTNQELRDINQQLRDAPFLQPTAHRNPETET